MNAFTPEESSLFAARTAQSWREQDASLREHDISRELAIDDFLQDTEKFADWVACANPLREPSAYFGPISTEELLRLLLNVRKVNAEQIVAAWKELQHRYVLCYATEIAQRILAIQGKE